MSNFKNLTPYEVCAEPDNGRVVLWVRFSGPGHEHETLNIALSQEEATALSIQLEHAASVGEVAPIKIRDGR